MQAPVEPTHGRRVFVVPFCQDPLDFKRRLAPQLVDPESGQPIQFPGYDHPEDVLGALEAAAGLAWGIPGTERLLLHIADAPGHGAELQPGDAELPPRYRAGMPQAWTDHLPLCRGEPWAYAPVLRQLHSSGVRYLMFHVGYVSSSGSRYFATRRMAAFFAELLSIAEGAIEEVGV